MANALLDFVMSLVSDPDAAASYAADPAQAIADANLAGVTTADVDHLIPVVTESVSAAPAAGLDAFGADAASNVWTSGAAAEAFQAFDPFGDQVPQTVLDDPYGTLNQIVTEGDPGVIDTSSILDSPAVPTVAGIDDLPQVDAPVIDDVPFDDGGWAQQVGDQLDQHDIPTGPELDDLI